MSAEGKVFYINHNDKTTHWTRPNLPLALLPEDEDSLPLEEVSSHDPYVPPDELLGKPLHSDLTDMQAEADHTPFATAESGLHSVVPSPATFDDPAAYTHPESLGNPHTEVEARVGAIDLAKEDPVDDVANDDVTDPALEEVADVHPRGVTLSSGGGERAPSATVSAPAGRATDRGLSGGGSGEGWDAAPAAQTEQQAHEAQQAQSVPHLRSADVLLLQTEMEVAAEEEEEEADARGKGGDGDVAASAGGPVSAIMKSGLFGSTVRAGGGGSGSHNGSATGGSGGARSSAAAGDSSAGGAGGDAASAVSGGGGVGSVSGEESGLGSEPAPLGLGGK